MDKFIHSREVKININTKKNANKKLSLNKKKIVIIKITIDVNNLLVNSFIDRTKISFNFFKSVKYTIKVSGIKIWP